MNAPTDDHKRDRAFVLSLLALSAFLRLLYLGRQSVWVDEMLTIVMSTPKPGYSIWDLTLLNIHGPLHAFAVFLAGAAHNTDAWLRTPSAVAGVASVGVFYAWTSRWLGRTSARAAALLLALHPLHVHYSQEVRNYAFVFFFAMLACYAFDRFCVSHGRRAGIAYALAVVGAALSNFTAAFLVAAHTLLYFTRLGVSRRTVGRWALVCVMVLVLISPWVYRVTTYIDVQKLVTPVLPGQIEPTERLRGETTVTWAAVPYALYAFGVGFTLGPSLRELHENASLSGVVSAHWPAVLAVGIVFGAALVLGLAAAARRRRDLFELAVYFAMPIVGTLLLNWQNAKVFNVRYVLLSLPAFACVLGMGKLRGVRWPAVACAAVMVASLWNYYFDGRYAKEDVKSATRYIEARLDTTGGDACILAPTVFQIVGRYQEGGAPVLPLYGRLPRASIDAQLDSLFARCNSVWYLRARPWVDDADGYVWRAIRAHYTEVEQADFDGVKVMHYVVENDGAPDG